MRANLTSTREAVVSAPSKNAQAEAALQELLGVTLASLGDAVLITDAEGRVTSLNPVAESLTGWTCQEAQGMRLESVVRMVHETSRCPAESPAALALRQGMVVAPANHTLLIARDGTEHPIDDRAAPMRGEQGEVTGVVLLFRDVSDRQQLELLPANTRTYAETSAETVREAVMVLDAGLRVKAANSTFYQAFRVAPAETENRVLFDLGNGQWNIPALRKRLEEVLPQNRSFQDFEVEATFPIIGSRTLRLSARRVYRDGNPTQTILFAIEDVTGRKQTACALEASEVRYRRLFETAQDAILILDGDSGLILDSNPILTDLLGYSTNELLGKELWELGPLQDVEASRAAFRQLQEEGYLRSDDLRLETKHGMHKEVEFVSSVYLVGQQRFVQCNIRDITDRKRAEAALKEADRCKDEFLAMLAHELRNPLAPLHNAVQVLQQKGTDDPDVRWARDVVARQVQQLTRLVDDLLDVSRISRGKISLQVEPVDMTDVVARSVEISRPLIDARKHHLKVSLPDQAVWVAGDLTRLAQVLSNLLNNAARYTRNGGRIDLTMEASRGEAVVRVRDTGIGIAAEELPHVFTMFTPVQATRSRAQGGLGIGLSLVRKLMEMHGGSVAATSDGPGRGSVFTVRLPLHPATTLGPARKPQPPASTAITPSRRVLVVDDNVDAAESLAVLLRLRGHEVRVAHDGFNALKMADNLSPEAIIVDIGMPGMDGLELAGRLRQDLGLKQALLIALTGYDQEEDRRRSQEAGFDDHLVKPVDVRAVERLLAGTALGDQVVTG